MPISLGVLRTIYKTADEYGKLPKRTPEQEAARRKQYQRRIDKAGGERAFLEQEAARVGQEVGKDIEYLLQAVAIVIGGAIVLLVLVMLALSGMRTV